MNTFRISKGHSLNNEYLYVIIIFYYYHCCYYHYYYYCQCHNNLSQLTMLSLSSKFFFPMRHLWFIKYQISANSTDPELLRNGCKSNISESIFQGSKITVYGKLEDHRLSKTFATRFDKSGYTFFKNSSLPPSLTYANIPSDTSLVIIYILFYLILLLLEN